MGVSLSSEQLARKFDRLAVALVTNTAAQHAVGAMGKTAFLAEAQRVGVGPPGSKVSSGVSARYDLKGPDAVLIRYTGPAHLIDRPTKPHAITARPFVGTRGRGRRAQRGAAVLAAFGVDARTGGVLKFGENFRPSVQHPGTPGKGFSRKAKALTAAQAPTIAGKVKVSAPLKAVFG